MSVKKILSKILQERVMVIDGAMGSYIKEKFPKEISEEHHRGELFKNHPKELTLKGNSDVFNITQPHMISQIHEDYLKAGADFVTTNTFSSTEIEQKKYGLEKYAHKMNVEACRIAKEQCKKYSTKDKPRFVLGSIGPLSKTLSVSIDVNDPSKRDVTFTQIVDSYFKQIEGLIEGGADVLLIETIFDVLNSKAAIYAAMKFMEKSGRKDIPIFMSATIEKSGRTLSGSTAESFYISVEHSNMFSCGLNCGQGADLVHPYLKAVSNLSLGHYVHAYPNAGMPNEFGQYNHTPEIMVDFVKPLLEEQLVNMIGGCCGTTPAHIKAIAKIVGNYKPRKIGEKNNQFKLSGIDKCIYMEGTFLHVGERCNVAGSKAFKNLIVNENYSKALSVARKQVETGAEILDICLDEPLLDGRKTIETFLNYLASDPGVSKVPIMIDSSKFEVITSGLRCLQGKCIVNSISLKGGEKKFIEEAKEIRKFGAAIVVMAFDEEGQAVTAKKKIEICKRSYDILVEKVGMPPQDIIFDPNVLTIGTGIQEHDNYAVEFINSCKGIREKCPHAKISGGVSNLSFSFRGQNKIRDAMHSVFLYHAIKEGKMNMAIVNMGKLPVYSSIDKTLLKALEDLVLNQSKEATNKLLKLAEEYKEERKEMKKMTVEERNKKINSWRNLEVEKRMEMALLKGIEDYIEMDINELLKKNLKPLDILEGPLMQGLNTIGELFGDGKMFLPQVIQSARIMKKSMAILTPMMKESEQKKSIVQKKYTILMATVKDDVHDIGKNIVGCVLECNNYNVIDIGTMVSCDKIIKATKNNNVDVIGLSALITPSLDQMLFNVKQFKREGFTIPIFVGGASTSEIHTAVKLAPHYFPIIHVKDASEAVTIMNSIVRNRDNYLNHIKEKYETLRMEYYKKLKSKNFVSHKEAIEGSLKINWNKNPPMKKPNFIGTKEFEFKIDKNITNKIAWIYYFYSFGFKPKFPYNTFPKCFECPKIGSKLKKLYEDSLELMKVLCPSLIGKCQIGFFPANVNGEDIEVYEDDNRNKVKCKFMGLRQQITKENSCDHYYSISDFIAPKKTKLKDYIGAYVGAIFGFEKVQKKYENDKYKYLMADLLCTRFAEAMAEYMHERVRKEKDLWGYSPKESLSLDDLFWCKYQGIRPALGYPTQPDHQEKWTLWKLMNVENKVGIKLLHSTMMVPKAATCCLYFSHEKSKYFDVGQIDKDQVESYAKRKGVKFEEMEKFLSPLIGYK